MGQRAEGELEPGEGFAGRSPLERLVPGLAQKAHGQFPGFTSESVVREPLGVLWQTTGVDPFDGCRDAGVERSAAVWQNPLVGHLVCQGMLERVLEVRRWMSLAEEIGRLQAVQAAAKRFLRQRGDRLQ